MLNGNMDTDDEGNVEDCCLSSCFIYHLLSLFWSEKCTHSIERRSSFEPFNLWFIESVIQFDRFRFTIRVFKPTFHLLEEEEIKKSHWQSISIILHWVLVYWNELKIIDHQDLLYPIQPNYQKLMRVNLVSSNSFL